LRATPSTPPSLTTLAAASAAASQEKYYIALGQSPEAIALMEVNPLQHRFKNFIELYRGEKLVQTFEVVAFDSSVCTPKSWYKSLIRTIRTEYQ
jgi:hypothetical protein